MFNKILIPLDGTKTSERALDVLRQWLEAGQITEAILIRVEPAIPVISADYVMRAEEVVSSDVRNVAMAKSYLDEIARSIDWKGVTHREIALTGEPTHALARFADREKVDLVMIGLEKRRGWSRLLRHSADYLVRDFSAPVLVIGQPAKTSAGVWRMGNLRSERTALGS